MIKAVIFDCFGVICVGARAYAVAQCPVPLRPQMDELFDQADYGFLTSRDFIDQAAALLGVTAEELQTMLDRQYARDETMLDMVRALRGSYRIGLLSNANDSIIRRLFSAEELDELFDQVVISSEVGMVKPQPELYALAATRLDCLPEECVMVDDVARNIQGAADVGMKGIVFADIQQCVRELQELGVRA